ncbi:MAG: EamA family transporter [Longimicrobiales bacterium]|nr:EamA family transporter [Longimicrobiales bacterium]
MSRKGDVATDLGLVALAAIWGVNFSVVKIVLGEIEPLAFNALRFPLAAAVLGWIVWRGSEDLLPHREDVPRLLLLGALGNVLYQLTFIIGIDWTFAGNASLLLSTTPVWTVILSVTAGHEESNRWVNIGVLGTLLGMALVVIGSGQELSLGSETLRGDLLMIAGSMLWSAYTVVGKRPVSRYGALRVTTWTLWAGTPILVVLGLPGLLRMDFTSVSTGSWLGLVYAGLFAIALAYVLWYRGVQTLGNSRTAVYSNLVPVWALITAWIWLGEQPQGLQLVGAASILFSLTIARLGQSSADPRSSVVSPEPEPS